MDRYNLLCRAAWAEDRSHAVIWIFIPGPYKTFLDRVSYYEFLIEALKHVGSLGSGYGLYDAHIGCLA